MRISLKPWEHYLFDYEEGFKMDLEVNTRHKSSSGSKFNTSYEDFVVQEAKAFLKEGLPEKKRKSKYAKKLLDLCQKLLDVIVNLTACLESAIKDRDYYARELKRKGLDFVEKNSKLQQALNKHYEEMEELKHRMAKRVPQQRLTLFFVDGTSKTFEGNKVSFAGNGPAGSLAENTSERLIFTVTDVEGAIETHQFNKLEVASIKSELLWSKIDDAVEMFITGIDEVITA